MVLVKMLMLEGEDTPNHQRIQSKSCEFFLRQKSNKKQYEIKLQEGNPAQDPTKQITVDLPFSIQECQAQGEDIVLYIDANKELDMNHTYTYLTLTKMTIDCKLECVHNSTGYQEDTYKDGKRQIDGILISSGIKHPVMRG